jgi:hypothetical protein
MTLVPGVRGRHDGVELVAAPEPKLERVSDLKLVAIDIKPGIHSTFIKRPSLRTRQLQTGK